MTITIIRIILDNRSLNANYFMLFTFYLLYSFQYFMYNSVLITVPFICNVSKSKIFFKPLI